MGLWSSYRFADIYSGCRNYIRFVDSIYSGIRIYRCTIRISVVSVGDLQWDHGYKYRFTDYNSESMVCIRFGIHYRRFIVQDGIVIDSDGIRVYYNKVPI